MLSIIGLGIFLIYAVLIAILSFGIALIILIPAGGLYVVVVIKIFFGFFVNSILIKNLRFIYCIPVCIWHMTAVTYSLFKQMVEDERKPNHTINVAYEPSTLVQDPYASNTVVLYSAADSELQYPSIDIKPQYSNINV